ncbi:MAG: host cell division inhibitor Icd-like protein, partial [Aeromonas sobria]|uniref:host cell division inhibitor Icd-like protein n=1 Tax=Aeromonas sobria TaxID=646 RepID=UPI003F2F756C
MIHSPLLSPSVQQSTILHATAKSVAGIGTPKLHKEPTHALAWFFVGARSPFYGEVLVYPSGSSCRVMVARVGQSQGWPVSSLCAGSSNPIRATAMRLEPLVDSNNLPHKEAAIMATIPTPVVFKTFTFLITHGVRRLAVLRYIRTIATSEALARANHADLPLVFVSRIPIG